MTKVISDVLAETILTTAGIRYREGTATISSMEVEEYGNLEVVASYVMLEGGEEEYYCNYMSDHDFLRLMRSIDVDA